MLRQIVKARQPAAKVFFHNARVKRAEPEADRGMGRQQAAQQIDQRRFRLEIPAVGGDLDAGQHDLMHPGLLQARGLLLCKRGRQRPHPPAGVRNDTIGAEIIAAILDLEQRTGAPLWDTRGQGFIFRPAVGFRRRLPALHGSLA